MTYWHCIKCRQSYQKAGIVAHRCSCGRWMVNITDIILEKKSVGDLTAQQVAFYQELLEARCLGI